MKRVNIELSAACAALALLFAGASVAASAAPAVPQQTPKPNIADDVEKRPNVEADPKPGPTPSRTPRQPKTPKPPPSYEVNIKTDIPEAEIFFGVGNSMPSQSLGKTDAEGKLTRRLPRGTYSLLASRPGYRMQRQRVEVRSGGPNDVSFNIAMPVVAKKDEEEQKPANPAPSPTPEEAAASAPSDPMAEADAVIKRALDVKEADGVRADDWKAMRQRVNAALEKDPANPQLKARSLAADGQLAYLAGDFATALVAFRQAAIAAPDLALAHYGLGNAYLATNQPAEAFKAYSRAVNVNSELALAYRGMGDALTKQNKTKEAAQYYNRAKSFGQPLPADTGLAAARDLKKRKRWAQALKEFQDVAATRPTSEVYVDIGDCYVGLEQPLSASQAYRKATEIDSRSALAHYKFGDVMHKMREWAAAMEAFERALALDLQGTVINRKRAREMADDAADKLKKMD